MVVGNFWSLSALRLFTMLTTFPLSQACLLPLGHWEDWDQDAGDITLTFHPPKLPKLRAHSSRHVHINCSIQPTPLILPQPLQSDANSSSKHQTATQNLTHALTITSLNAQVAVPIGESLIPRPNDTRIDQISLEFPPEEGTEFTIKAIRVGHAVMLVNLLIGYDFNDWDNFTQVLPPVEYHITVIRELRRVDTIYNCVVASVAVLNSFSMGCASDWPSFRMHIRHPKALLAGLGCQLIALPLVAVGIALALKLPAEEGLGLLFTACLPAGGAGHIIVSFIRGDHALSVSLNLLSIIAAAISAPLVIFGMGRFLAPVDTFMPSLYRMELWLAASAGAHLLGTFLHVFQKNMAEAFLNWFVKPFLLLFCILFITLGTYINLYIFDCSTSKTLQAAVLLPSAGFFTGAIVPLLSRQDAEYMKTIATETTISNWMLTIAMVRFSFSEPAADLTSMVPMWVLFLSPTPFIVTYFGQRIKGILWRRCVRRHDRQFRHFSIVSSILNVTNVTNISSSISPKLNSPNDDSATLIDEKVTVL